MLSRVRRVLRPEQRWCLSGRKPKVNVDEKEVAYLGGPGGMQFRVVTHSRRMKLYDTDTGSDSEVFGGSFSVMWTEGTQVRLSRVGYTVVYN